MSALKNPHAILITGASSGLGAALARHYAAAGRRLVLGGRDSARLAATADACRGRGAMVECWVGDITDRDEVRRWIEGADDAGALDLVIANAGVSAGTGDAGESEAQARRIFRVNLDGVLNTLHPAMDRMVPRGHGQLAVISSIAGYRGFPGAPAYSASKAAAKAYGEALRLDLKPAGIALSVVCPGFIATPMTAVNRFRMPFLLTPEKAAAVIARRLARNRPRIAFPWPTAFMSWFVAALPCAVADRILGRLPTKAAER